MFEYEDEFLMNNSAKSLGLEDMYHLCSVESAADDQLAELARLVGGGGSSQPRKTETINLVDNAPRLEFDLEQELTKAFASMQHTLPELAEPALKTDPALITDTSSPQSISPPIPTLTSAPTPEPISEPISAPADFPIHSLAPAPLPHVNRAPVEPRVEPAETAPTEPAVSAVVADVSKSELDLDELISKEFALALKEESSQPESEVDAGYVNAIDKATDTFDAELARLMGSAQTSGVAAHMPPPIPELTIAPPDEPVIVKPTTLPPVSEPEVQINSVSNSQPAQMSDFDVASNQTTAPREANVAASKLANFDQSHAVEARRDSDSAPGDVASLDNEIQPAVDPAAEPIVTSEINLGDLKDSESSFHGDKVSIPEPHAAVLAQGNRSGGKRAAGSLIALALVAGAGLAGWNAVSGGNKSVPTILASTEPVKIKPKEAGGTVVPNQDQAVYRSVESSKKVEPKQESLKDNSEKPIVVAKKVTTVAGKTETRIKRDELSTAAGPVLKPRKVRTVVVKPDGTILTQTSGVKTTAPKLVSQSAPAKPKPVAKVAKVEKVEPKKVFTAATKPAPAEKTASLKTPEPVKKVVEAVAKPVPVKKPAPAKKVAAVKKLAPAKKVAAVKKPAPVTKAKPATKVASVKKPVPVKKPNPVKKKTESVKSTASVKSAYAVQVASQRSPEAAERTFKVLARRYASVFRGQGMDIRKADLKGKGIYYRARIPVQTKAGARKLCQQLKAKGGDCFVTR